MLTTGYTMRYLIYLAFLTSMSLNAGPIQKWTDEEGKVHYGDAPPLKAKTEDVRVQSAPSNPGRKLPRLSSPDTENSNNASNSATNDSDVPADQAKIACTQATEDLQVMNRSSRVKLRAADGSTRYMSTEEIEDRKNQAQADIDRYCR